MPHISLVFREMWDTTAVNLQLLELLAPTQVKVPGIPHLAKNQRDVGHPASLTGTALSNCYSVRFFPVIGARCLCGNTSPRI